MKKWKQLTTVVFVFALIFLAAITYTCTPVQAAGGYTFDKATGTLVINSNEGLEEYKQDEKLAKINYKDVHSVVFNSGVTKIKSSAFYDYSMLVSVTIADTVTTIERNAFMNCVKLENITIPASVTSLEDGAFGACESFTSITIPASVTNIGKDVFKEAIKLSEIKMKSVTPSAFGTDVFKDIVADFKIYVPYKPKGTVDTYKAAAGWSVYKDHIVEEPHDTAFSSGIYTYETTGDDTVTVTGFVKGKSTAKMTISKSVTYKGDTYRITEIADKAFYKNSKIKSVNIANNVTKIGKSAFEGCSKITAAVIGNKVSEIRTSAFFKCTSLEKVTIGTGVKIMGNHVFCNDKKLREIVIKSSKLTTIGKHNLYKCTNLKIKVPSSKVNAYTKLFKGQGQKANVKVM